MPANPHKPYTVPKRFLGGLSTREALGVRSALAYFEAKNPYTKLVSATALADAPATLTIAQLFDGGIFTITPGAGRALTLPTTAAIIAALCPNGLRIGASAEITIISLAAQAATLTAGDGSTTIVGSAAANNAAATWKVVVTGATTVVCYRI